MHIKQKLLFQKTDYTKKNCHETLNTNLITVYAFRLKKFFHVRDM